MMRYAVFFLGILLTAAVARGETIRLMARAVASDPVIRLGNIASIDDATPAVRERIAQTIIVTKLESGTTVRAEDILFAVLQQNQDLSLAASLVVRGAAQCTVTLEGASPVTTPVVQNTSQNAQNIQTIAPGAPGTARANQAIDLATERQFSDGQVPTAAAPAAPVLTAPVSPSAPPATQPGGGPKFAPGSLADQITQSVLKDFSATPAQMEITINTSDPVVLGATPDGERWSFHSTAGRSLGTMQWEAHLLKDNKPVNNLWVQATVCKRMMQVVTLFDVHRGDLVAADMVQLQEIKADRLTPDLISDSAEVIGKEALRPMAAGTSINRHDFVAADAVQPGDTVTVYFMSGGLTIKATAKAMDRAKLGQSVKIQNEHKDIFEATPIAKRIVVVGTIDDATLRLLRESK